MNESLPFGINEIKKLIPHRYPFLLLDKVIHIVPNQSIISLKNISICNPVFQGHFPQEPIYPGVLLIESLAQASGILGNYGSTNKAKELLLTEVISARFRQKVVPGDTVYFFVSIEKKRRHFCWFSGEAKVNNEVILSVKFSAFMR